MGRKGKGYFGLVVLLMIPRLFTAFRSGRCERLEELAWIRSLE